MKIKWMLGILVAAGVLFTGLLILFNNSSMNQLVDSSKTYDDIVIPLEVASDLKTSVEEIGKIRESLIEAKTDAELEPYLELSRLQKKITEEIKKITENKGKIAKIVPSKMIGDLKRLIKGYSEKNKGVYENVNEKLRIEKGVRKQIVMLDGPNAELRRNAEKVSDRIGQAIEELTPSGTQSDGLSADLTDFLKTPLNRLQKVSNDLRFAIMTITDFGGRVLTAMELKKIESLEIGKLTDSISQIKTALGDFKLGGTDSQELLELIEKIDMDFSTVRKALKEGDNSVISTLNEKWKPILAKIDTDCDQLKNAEKQIIKNLKNLKDIANTQRSEAKKKTEMATTYSEFIMYLGFVMIIIFLVSGLWINNRIFKPVNNLIEFADTLSKGDLTARIDIQRDDEFGQLVSKLGLMSKNLNALIGQVQRSGIQITSSATELTATAKQQEAVMKTQLESTNYVVKSIGEISNVSEELVETMKKVAAMSDQTAGFASSGQTDLAQMEEAMNHMENASKSISDKLEAINEKAANITSVVTTITKVADQTDLLSLNAAIEAEKAGESGRGFTVVAREIRRLADQTAVATLDIDQMVKEMQSAVSAGVMEMDAFITEVHRSADSVGKISKQLTRIIEQVQALSPSFEGVNESMQIQSGNAQQINNSMVNLSEEMQQTVQSLRESFLAIEQLNSASKGLQDEVSRFRVIS